MARTLAILVMATTTIATSYAGQIMIGQLSGSVNEGLTTSYLNGSAQCAGIQLGMTASCVSTTSPTGQNTAALKSYSSNLYSGLTLGTPAIYTGYPLATDPGSSTVLLGSKATNGATFAMIQDGTNSDNYWSLNTPSTATVTIPMGIFGVQDVWTMLNDLWGCSVNNGNCAGKTNQNTDVSFTFDANANGSDAASLETVTFDLVNGQEIRDAIQCTGGTGTTTCANYATSLVASNNMAATLSGAATGSQNFTVTTNNNGGNPLYSGTYSAASGAGNYSNTTGTVSLGDQNFQFGTSFLGEYLVSMTVTDSTAASGVSRASLTAVTVDYASAATPEPATIFLLVAGLGLIAFTRLRRA